ncbi:MAG: DUF1552 domain-containing protein [Lentisphaeraceae bacterium]|nr:DUF1552 domain-containing protein [Lentisphaeraceae bacterium]
MFINRRNLIKSGIAALSAGLPLQSNAETNQYKFKLKKNIVLVTVDLGLYGKNFQEGAENCHYFQKCFSHLKEDVTYFNGMSEPILGGGHRMQHASLTCMTYQQRERYPDRPFVSLDQLIAETSVQESRHKSIYHKINSGGSVSFNTKAQPTPYFDGHDKLHEDLFGVTDMGLVKRNLRKKQYILKELFINVRRRWKGTPVEQRLVDSLKSEIEGIDTQLKWLKVRKPRMNFRTDKKIEEAPGKHLNYNFNTLFHALEKEQTKIAVVHIGDVAKKLGLGGHHHLTHHGNLQQRISGLETVDTCILNALANFVEKLKTAEMLDDTIVLFTCAMADASAHSSRSVPAFLFGGGFKHKKSIDCQDGREIVKPTSHLFSSILKQAGSPSQSFSGNNSIIEELFV